MSGPGNSLFLLPAAVPVGNILLDVRTARVVHIDLGIAFEQGLYMNTAEQVPFRLTADVIDGMGAAGVEGPMRKACEETLKVGLRFEG